MTRARATLTVCLALLVAPLSGCSDNEGGCVGGCDQDLGAELYGPADPADWTSFRNGPTRGGVSAEGTLGQEVRIRWQQTNFMVSEYSAVKPSAAVWDNRVFVPSDDGFMWAFERENGEVLWSVPLSDAPQGIHGSPVAARRVVWIGTYSGNLHALEPETGREIYRFSPGRWIGSSPLFVPEQQALYVSHETSAPDLPGAGLVTRNDPRTGQEIWRSELLPHYPHSSVAADVTRNLVFVGANDGGFRAFDSESGALLWARDFEPGDDFDPSTADIKTTPAVSPAAGLVVFGTWDRRVYALDVETGATIWSVDTGGRLMGSPAIDEERGRVFVGTTRRSDALLSLELASGAVRWRLDTGSGISASPAIDGDGEGVIVGDDGGLLWGVEADSGEVRWSFPADGPLTASPAWVGREIFIAANEGSLYALETVD